MTYFWSLGLVAYCYVLSVSAVFGQSEPKKSFSAHQWQATVVGGVGKSGELAQHYKPQGEYRHSVIQAQAGYYLVNRLMIGIGLSWSAEWSPEKREQESFTDFTKGPLLRYHFTNTRLSPFVDASYQVGQRHTGPRSLLDFNSSSVHSFLVGTGLSLRLMAYLRLSASYGFQLTRFGDSSVIYHTPQVSISFVTGDKR